MKNARWYDTACKDMYMSVHKEETVLCSLKTENIAKKKQVHLTSNISQEKQAKPSLPPKQRNDNLKESASLFPLDWRTLDGETRFSTIRIKNITRRKYTSLISLETENISGNKFSPFKAEKFARWK